MRDFGRKEIAICLFVGRYVLPCLSHSCLSTTSHSCVVAISILAISSECVSMLDCVGATYLDSVAKSESKAVK